MSSPSCSVCHGTLRPLSRLNGFTLYHCLNCTHLQSVFDQDSKRETYTPEYFNEKHKNWFNHPDLRLFDKVLSSVKRFNDSEDPHILDVGCGMGNFLKYAHQNGYRHLFGLDLAKNEATEYKLIQADFSSFETDQKFDVITTMMNIEHLDDVQSYILKLGHLTKDDGLIIINTIDSSSLIYRMAQIMDLLGIRFAAKRLFEAHHVNHFNQKSLTKLTEAADLQVVDLFKKNYPMNAIDTGAGTWLELPLKLIISSINAISWLLGMQISQTIVVRKRPSSRKDKVLKQT